MFVHLSPEIGRKISGSRLVVEGWYLSISIGSIPHTSDGNFRGSNHIEQWTFTGINISVHCQCLGQFLGRFHYKFDLWPMPEPEQCPNNAWASRIAFISIGQIAITLKIPQKPSNLLKTMYVSFSVYLTTKHVYYLSFGTWNLTIFGKVDFSYPSNIQLLVNCSIGFFNHS